MAFYTAYAKLIHLAHALRVWEKLRGMGIVSVGSSRGKNVAVDNQYSTDIKVCDPRIRGSAVCNMDGKCSVCVHANKFEILINIINIL